MKRLLVFALALTAIYTGFWLARPASVRRPSQPEIDQWEGEGGAVRRDGGVGNRRPI